jgi:hypothetical protein
MADDGQFAPRGVAADHCQPIIAVFGDLSGRQSVER